LIKDATFVTSCHSKRPSNNCQVPLINSLPHA
jgi:hypothetical protein